MMKKTIKKLLAALLAVAMVCAMAIPAFAYNPGETEENLNGTHGYSAFQIFKGVISKDNPTLSGVDWGQNITEPDIFLANLKNDPTIGEKFETAATAQEVLAVISQWSNSDDNSIAFARVVCSYLYPNADAKPEPVITDHTGGINIPKSGYYLIVDTSSFSSSADGDSYHAYNSFFLLNVPQVPYVVPINRKVVKPTVEKEVYDNQDGTNEAGFGSSADHAINEEFQFKLTATLPDSTNRAYDYYDKYSVIFHDTLSEGITYDGPYSVVIESKVNPGNRYDITDSSTIDISKLESQNYFEVNIPDVKTCAEGLDLNKGATITVTYTAHLNDKAYVNTEGGSTSNINKVYLTYSNNPKDESSIGKTPESTPVYVYTYQLNNTKYRDDDTPGNELAGAGFRLYSGKDCTKEQEIKLKKNITDGTYSPYFGTAAGDEMFSDEHGQFNVKGLDAGTYYLKETKTPDDYSPCPDKKIVISATHNEYNVNLSGESNLNNKIINIKAGGITLPSTGGIGTTIFYVVGGGLMVAAIVLLVTKKRMENK